MPDPIDDGREALESVGPSRDLWADATTRAADGGSVPLAPLGKPARGGTWLAVAAAAALVAGIVGVLSMDDDASVDTTPSGKDDGPAEVTVHPGRDGSCSFGVSGEPIVLAEGPADPPLFDPTGQPEDQTITHAALGAQVAEIHVPGLVLDDLLGERVEDIQLERGTAQLWFGLDFVQVRWFTGSQDLCASFTVTVAGGTEDGNRHAAVDLADRILLQDEISAELPPGGEGVLATIEGAWQLERSTVDGEPTDGGGLAFTFAGGDAIWTDGCNTFAGAYESVGSTGVRLGRVTFTDVTSSAIACPRNPTAVAVQSVMGAERIAISFDGDLLLLAANNSTPTLRPADGDTSAEVDEDFGFVWPIILPNDEVYDGPFDLSSGQSTALAYATSALWWRDARIREGEPSEDGRNGQVFIVESPELGGAVEVWVAVGSGPLANVVYRVDVPGREPTATTSIHVSGTTARIDPGSGPEGTATAAVKLVFDGEVLGEGAPAEAIQLSRPPSVPGVVSAYFLDGDGRCLSAWARPVASGDSDGT